MSFWLVEDARSTGQIGAWYNDGEATGSLQGAWEWLSGDVVEVVLVVEVSEEEGTVSSVVVSESSVEQADQQALPATIDNIQ